jgi:hypothetical protein
LVALEDVPVRVFDDGHLWSLGVLLGPGC